MSFETKNVGFVLRVPCVVLVGTFVFRRISGKSLVACLRGVCCMYALRLKRERASKQAAWREETWGDVFCIFCIFSFHFSFLAEINQEQVGGKRKRE